MIVVVHLLDWLQVSRSHWTRSSFPSVDPSVIFTCGTVPFHLLSTYPRCLVSSEIMIGTKESLIDEESLVGNQLSQIPLTRISSWLSNQNVTRDPPRPIYSTNIEETECKLWVKGRSGEETVTTKYREPSVESIIESNEVLKTETSNRHGYLSNDRL